MAGVVGSQGAAIRVVPLGAGQDVGRSCVLVSLGGKNVRETPAPRRRPFFTSSYLVGQIMFDCGMHMGYNDARRFPDFSFVTKSGNHTQSLSAVIITHL